MKQKVVGWGTAVFIFLILTITACAVPAAKEASGEVEVLASGTVVPPTRGEVVVELPDMGEAPEFLNEVWLNSDGPVTLAAQRGKVVLLEFWTFG
ncbi:hypothetical protein [Candidatus Leptofilum sp.]|uniref:hypothetical protein n=1 Tax=Candidatus Leptofilum sp. TaxID=3241576 RepID=UPI003B5937EA